MRSALSPWNDRKINDRKIEELIGNLLRAGVLLSALVVFIGGIVYLSRHGGGPADYRNFHGEPSQLRTISGVLGERLVFQGRAIGDLGLMLLMRSTVVLVAFSILGLAVERDCMFVAFGVSVFASLIY